MTRSNDLLSSLVARNLGREHAILYLADGAANRRATFHRERLVGEVRARWQRDGGVAQHLKSPTLLGPDLFLDGSEIRALVVGSDNVCCRGVPRRLEVDALQLGRLAALRVYSTQDLKVGLDERSTGDLDKAPVAVAVGGSGHRGCAGGEEHAWRPLGASPRRLAEACADAPREAEDALHLALGQRPVDQSTQLLSDERPRGLLRFVEQLRVTVGEARGVVAQLALETLDYLGLHSVHAAGRLDLCLDARLESEQPLELSRRGEHGPEVDLVVI